MMAFFDSLVQREIEGFEGSSSSSSSDEEANGEEEYSQTVVEPEEDDEEENIESETGENIESESGYSQRRERVLQRISLNVADGLLSSDVGAGHRVRVVEEVSFTSCLLMLDHCDIKVLKGPLSVLWALVSISSTTSGIYLL